MNKEAVATLNQLSKAGCRCSVLGRVVPVAFAWAAGNRLYWCELPCEIQQQAHGSEVRSAEVVHGRDLRVVLDDGVELYFAPDNEWPLVDDVLEERAALATTLRKQASRAAIKEWLDAVLESSPEFLAAA